MHRFPGLLRHTVAPSLSITLGGMYRKLEEILCLFSFDIMVQWWYHSLVVVPDLFLMDSFAGVVFTS